MSDENKKTPEQNDPIIPKLSFSIEAEPEESVTPSEPEEESAAEDTPAVSQKENSPKKKKKRKKRRIGGIIYVACMVLIAVSLATFIIMVGNDVYGMYKDDKDIQVNIPEGATTNQIASILKEEGVIEHPWLFCLTSRIGDHDGTYHYGLYELNSKMPYSEIIYALQQTAPDIETVTLTINGAMSVVEIANMLENSGVCDSDEFLDSLQNESHGFAFESSIVVDRLKFQQTEGYMLPGTYEFFKGENVDTVIEKIYQNFNDSVYEGLADEIEESGRSLEEILTIASLIEAESVDTSEMATMASVLLNRLSNPLKYPRLELDCTTDYVNNIIEKYSSLANTEMCDAYDTYVCEGLPIGPICNPSVEAIEAVLNPAGTGYYFYYVDDITKAVQYTASQDEYEAWVAAEDE